MREYAYGLLEQAGELEGARDRHLAHYCQLADAGKPGLDSWPSRSAERLVNDLGHDYENVRAALEWGAATDPCAARASFVAARDLFMLFAQSDGRRLADQQLERCPTRDRERVEIQITAGLLAMMTVDVEAATSALGEARELAAELDERALEGWATFFHGLTETLAGQFDSAQPLLDESRALHRGLRVRIGEGVASAALGLGAAMRGDTETGQELLEEALSIQAAEGYRWGQGQPHLYLGMIAEATGSREQSPSTVGRPSSACSRYGDSPLLPMALVCQASTLLQTDALRRASDLAAAAGIRARVGGAFAPVFRSGADRVSPRPGPRSALGADQAPRIWADGARLAAPTRRSGSRSGADFESADRDAGRVEPAGSSRSSDWSRGSLEQGDRFEPPALGPDGRGPRPPRARQDRPR